MEKVGFILEKNESPLFVCSHVHVIKENGSNFVDLRLSDDDFKVLYTVLRTGVADAGFQTERLLSLIDLFQSIYSRL